MINRYLIYIIVLAIVDLRPISISSCIAKIFEKLIMRHFERYIKLDNILLESQFGFRKGCFCDHCLAYINLEAYKVFMQGNSWRLYIYLGYKGGI